MGVEKTGFCVVSVTRASIVGPVVELPILTNPTRSLQLAGQAL